MKRYGTVRPFLGLLAISIPLAAIPAGQPILTALHGLNDLVGRKRVGSSEIVDEVVTGSWRRLVLANPELPAVTVDYRAYVLCVLEQMHRALRRRDVYAVGSTRWGDPRIRLLDGAAWQQSRPQVLTALRLTGDADTYLADLADRLDTARAVHEHAMGVRVSGLISRDVVSAGLDCRSAVGHR